MKKITHIILIISGLFLLGCTQLVTAPISIAGTVAKTTFGVAGAAGGMVVDTVIPNSGDN
ncbi:MAG: hypothetical protein LGB07_02345 [Sulfurovum sp.]|nr:hypothetical protein [Sulfurovum sp.]MCB4744479.1 hypothetical protein [Sulfurovum sp.]MCB4745533.1 hypothetical protein [Sulfurovum sp.]MCB4749753.1 hypothetical protein [Sulfurovum sp.]MCB4750656.1 hypothetical protein [Sulfurovum sp.]